MDKAELKAQLQRLHSDMRITIDTIQKAIEADDFKSMQFLNRVYVDLFSEAARVEAMLKLME